MNLHKCYGQHSFNIYNRTTDEDRSRISQEWAEIYKSYHSNLEKSLQDFFVSYHTQNNLTLCEEMKKQLSHVMKSIVDLYLKFQKEIDDIKYEAEEVDWNSE